MLFAPKEKGQGLVEYVVLIAAFGLAAWILIAAFGAALSPLFDAFNGVK